jgi:tetratricopeptide (TPR) repeat protein
MTRSRLRPLRRNGVPRPLCLVLASLPLLTLAAGCAQATSQPKTPASQTEPPRTDTGTTVLTATDGGTPVELFDRAKKLFVEEKYKEAADLFDLVQKGDPQGRLAPMALYQAGLCFEALGDREKALARFEQVATDYPKDPLQKLARLHATRVLNVLERWSEMIKLADEVLARADLSVAETVEAQGAKALALAEKGDVEAAGRLVEDTRTLMEKHHLGESGRLSYEVAQVFFVLGEVRRLRSEKIVFDPLPPNFGEAFEQRAQGLLDAQAAYTDTMRTTDVAWATMAGYRVGELYQELHRDVMAAKFPAVAKSAKDRQLFEGAMRLRYRILLEKGLKMMNSTVGMTDRMGEASVWSARAKAAKAEIEKSLAAENTAIAKLPISEADLKKLLDDLQAKRDVERAKPQTP